MSNSHIIWPYSNPLLLELGSFRISWYGAIFAIGLLMAQRLLSKMYTKEGRDVEEIDRLAIFAVIFGVLGARLGHCLFYEADIYLRDPIKILYIWQGGLASHGGLIGLFIGLSLYCLKKETPKMLWLLDHLVFPLCVLSACIRTANFVNGEIFGNTTELPWGIIFSAQDMLPRHPVQLYEASAYIMIGLSLWPLYRKKYQQEHSTQYGLLFGLFMSLISIARFSLEYLKAPVIHSDAFNAISTGQWLTIPTFVLGICLILWAKRPRHSI